MREEDLDALIDFAQYKATRAQLDVLGALIAMIEVDRSEESEEPWEAFAQQHGMTSRVE